jgi:septum formation protein
MGLNFTFAGVDIDEAPADGESASEMVLRLAEAKAVEASRTKAANLPIIGADTVVVCDNRILGKPASKEEALEMLAVLSGKSHQVLTAVAILANQAAKTAVSTTDVRFRDIPPDEALAYWQSGEPEGKAGAYAIQGRGGVFARSIAGSYSGVVGLPVFETAALLKSVGIDVLKDTAVQVQHD